MGRGYEISLLRASSICGIYEWSELSEFRRTISSVVFIPQDFKTVSLDVLIIIYLDHGISFSVIKG